MAFQGFLMQLTAIIYITNSFNALPLALLLTNVCSQLEAFFVIFKAHVKDIFRMNHRVLRLCFLRVNKCSNWWKVLVQGQNKRNARQTVKNELWIMPLKQFWFVEIRSPSPIAPWNRSDAHVPTEGILDLAFKFPTFHLSIYKVWWMSHSWRA